MSFFVSKSNFIRAILASEINAGGVANRVVATTDGTTMGLAQITNAMVSSSAAITASKLAAGGTANRVVGTTDGTNTTLLQVTNAMVDSSAAIAVSKLATGTKGQFLQAGASTPAYAPISRINRLINGDFRVSQRNVTNTVTMIDNTYQGPDRWRSLHNTTSGTTPLVSQYGAGPGDGYGQYSVAITAQGGTGKFGVMQVIETKDCYDLRGQTVSFQFQCYPNASISGIRAGVLCWTGTGDAATTDPVSNWGSNQAGITTLNTNWVWATGSPTTLSLTGNAWNSVKIEGVTISTSATNVAVIMWYDGGTPTNGHVLLFNEAQLERGSLCTEFEHIMFSTSLNMCRRFCWKNVDLSVVPFTTTTARPYIIEGDVTTGRYYIAENFPFPLFKTPTITSWPYTTATNTGRSSNGGGSDYGANSAVTSGNTNSFNIQNNSGGTLTNSGNNLFFLGLLAEAEL